MIFGLIKWFNEEKGFGVIVSTDDSKEIFLHISQWKDKEKISTSNKIPFVFTTAIQRNKLSAVNCKYFNFNDKEHWQNLFNLYSKSDNIKVEYQTYNITELTLNSIPENFNFTIIDTNIQEIINEFSDDDLINKTNLFHKIINSSNNRQLKDYIFDNINKRLLSLSPENQILIFNKQIFKDFLPSKDILINNHHLLEIKYLSNIKDNEILNLIVLKKINELENNFEIEQFQNFSSYISLINTVEFKKVIINKLNSEIGSLYKNLIVTKIKEVAIISENATYEIKQLISKHPSFISAETIELWKLDYAKAIISFSNYDVVFQLYKEGIISDISVFLVNNLAKFDTKHFEIIIRNETLSKGLEKEIFEIQLSKNNFEFVLSFSKKYFPELFIGYDKIIFEKTEQSVYFEFWSKGLGEILPINYLINYFDYTATKYAEIDKWIDRKIISIDAILNVLLTILKNIKQISNRKEFYTKFYCIKKYISTNKGNFEQISLLNDTFNNLILWHLNYTDNFDLNLLKKKFIYFKPDDQVYIFKRLFYLKHTKQIDFNFDELDEIVRADISLFLLNEKFTNDFVLDISTHTIIEAIKSYLSKGNFLFESDLILKDLKNNRNKKFKIQDYFEQCNGRMTAEYNWHSEGKIKQIRFPNNPELFYYGIEFPTGIEREGRNYYGSYTYIEKNPNFEHLKDEVKKLPKVKWNPEKKHWGVPATYKDEVYLFAKENRFFIELENKKHYDNNIHLVEFSKYKDNEPNIPIGINFCEGRKSKILHNKFKNEFWWCVNEACFLNAEINHLDNSFKPENEQNKKIWEYYTLLDILRILGINTDENKSSPIDFVKDGNYYKLIGHINAFNRLVEKLYCLECGDLLYPTETSHFALYRDVKFHCENQNCNQYKKVIYLNHCLNGECANIVDSRVSKQCELKLYICDKCGTCCSFAMFKRRLENLKLVGGYIHPELVENVELEKGHLERAEYYCYKCKKMMTQISENLYKCNSCNVSYDFEKYKWLNKKWTMKPYRRKDYPLQNNK